MRKEEIKLALMESELYKDYFQDKDFKLIVSDELLDYYIDHLFYGQDVVSALSRLSFDHILKLFRHDDIIKAFYECVKLTDTLTYPGAFGDVIWMGRIYGKENWKKLLEDAINCRIAMFKYLLVRYKDELSICKLNIKELTLKGNDDMYFNCEYNFFNDIEESVGSGVIDNIIVTTGDKEKLNLLMYDIVCRHLDLFDKFVWLDDSLDFRQEFSQALAELVSTIYDDLNKYRDNEIVFSIKPYVIS